MLFRTHLALAFLGILYFLPIINNKIIFCVVLIIATIIPDIDSYNSYIGNRWYLRPFQWATKQRGVLHSFTFCILVALVLAFILPTLAFPFYLGYGIHLIADMFTSDGIRPFWPFKDEVEGKILTGGSIEKGIFYSILLVDVLLFIRLFA